MYLIGLVEGLLTHQRSMAGDDGAIAEERRLAYVGITRAKDQLTITWAASRTKWGKRRPTIPSRFLREMRGEGEGRDEPAAKSPPPARGLAPGQVRA